MKVCFVLQNRFAYPGHAMIKTLKKKYGEEEFCGYVYTRPSFNFLTSQKEIIYSRLLLDDDIHSKYKTEQLDLPYIQWIEKEFGLPNLWAYVELDRIVRYGLFVREYPHNTPPYTHEEMLRIIQVKSKAILKFLEEERPDFIVFSVMGDIGMLLLYHMAKKRGIKILYITEPRINAQFTISNYYNGIDSIEEAFKTNIDESYINQAKKFLDSFRQNPVSPNSIDTPQARAITKRQQFKFLSPKRFIRSFLWTIRVFLDYAKNRHKNDYTEIKPWYYILDHVKRKMRVLRGFNDLYDKIDLKEDYAFFPLQVEPEISSLLLAPFYTDQLWLAKQIARSLPIHFKLYIKEHPAMFGYRTRSFYKELKKIPNVKLIDPCITSFNITKNAKLIVTQTGGVGWEGLFFKKPVITFGNIFYNILPMTKKCKAIEDLPHIIKEQLENFHYDEKLLIKLIAASYQESAHVDLVQIWEIDGGGKMDEKENQLMPLTDLLAKKMGLKKPN
ncbi:MAG: hypothetical protein HZC14_00205 [Candidatus Niyogibacteria bacterium]|nr:hypothetical protein [Candidatus Niyogibacteria bacterium]